MALGRQTDRQARTHAETKRQTGTDRQRRKRNKEGKTEA